MTNVKAIYPYGIRRLEVLGRNILQTKRNIIPYSILSTEKLSNLTRLLSSDANIRPYGVRSIERVGLHTLSSNRNNADGILFSANNNKTVKNKYLMAPKLKVKEQNKF